jgi:hypothetical protein
MRRYRHQPFPTAAAASRHRYHPVPGPLGFSFTPSCHVSRTEAFLGLASLGDSLSSAELLAAFLCFSGVCRDVVACAPHVTPLLLLAR